MLKFGENQSSRWQKQLRTDIHTDWSSCNTLASTTIWTLVVDSCLVNTNCFLKDFCSCFYRHLLLTCGVLNSMHKCLIVSQTIVGDTLVWFSHHSIAAYSEKFESDFIFLVIGFKMAAVVMILFEEISFTRSTVNISYLIWFKFDMHISKDEITRHAYYPMGHSFSEREKCRLQVHYFHEGQDDHH